MEFRNIFLSGKPGDRAMPTMASGMEAEEETEHHLQRAIATETVSDPLLTHFP